MVERPAKAETDEMTGESKLPSWSRSLIVSKPEELKAAEDGSEVLRFGAGELFYHPKGVGG